MTKVRVLKQIEHCICLVLVLELSIQRDAVFLVKNVIINEAETNKEPRNMSTELKKLRDRLDVLDVELVKIAAERQRIVSKIGQSKKKTGKGTRDFKREREVMDNVRREAANQGIAPELAETLLETLIRYSLAKQEQELVLAQGKGSGKSAIVIGGAGRIGRWLVDFLNSQGYRVAIADPACDAYGAIRNWRESSLDHDLIVVAAPIKISNEILLELAERQPDGVIIEVSSIKEPVKSGLTALREKGCRFASIHPMFGPDTRLLSGKHIVMVDFSGSSEKELIESLFSATMARLVDMDLDTHDKMISYVLGLTHFINIAFFAHLSQSGITAAQLKHISSTTFEHQLEISAKVATENPSLYFEIQNQNPFSKNMLAGLQNTFNSLKTAIDTNDSTQFVSLFEGGKRYVEELYLNP